MLHLAHSDALTCGGARGGRAIGVSVGAFVGTSSQIDAYPRRQTIIPEEATSGESQCQQGFPRHGSISEIHARSL